MATQSFDAADFELLNYTLTKFVDTYRSHEAVQLLHAQSLDDEAYRQLFAKFSPPMAKHIEGMTRQQMEREAPQLAIAWAVAVSIVAALKQQGSPQE